jgi:hypothetical protein
MRPRYMTVPFPAPCHINVAGVGQLSVWGLRIIACISSSLLHHSCDSSIPKMASILVAEIAAAPGLDVLPCDLKQRFTVVFVDFV